MKPATIEMAAEAVELSRAVGYHMPNLLDYEDTKNFLEEYGKVLEEQIEYLREMAKGWEKPPTLFGALTTSEFNQLRKELKGSMGISF